VRTQARNGQSEVSQTAKQVGDSFAGLRLKQGHGAPDQHAIDTVVDLGELGRMEDSRSRPKSGNS
jgi:hypothetical protein